jgi:HAMP domain-containing protein
MEARLHIDLTLISPVSALLGALIGGAASLVAAIYTQRRQDWLQRIACEVAKRETVYAEFVMTASNLLLNAYTKDEIELNGDEQRLIGLINRMMLFAPPDVVGAAEAALRAIVEIFLKPGIEVRQLAKKALSNNLDPDPLMTFSSICRADLDNVRRNVR